MPTSPAIASLPATDESRLLDAIAAVVTEFNDSGCGILTPMADAASALALNHPVAVAVRELQAFYNEHGTVFLGDIRSIEEALAVSFPRARIWALAARIPGAPAAFNIARNLTKERADALLAQYNARAHETRFPHEFSVRVSTEAPK